MSLPFLGCPVCPAHEPPAQPSCAMVTQMKTSCPCCPSEPQGCDSRATTTLSPPRTAWPQHPRAAHTHQGEALTTSWVCSSAFSPPHHTGLLEDLIYKGNTAITSWGASGDCKALAGHNTQLQCPQCHENKSLFKCSGSLWFSTKGSCSSCSGAAQNCVGSHTALPQKMPCGQGLSLCLATV